MKKSIRLSILNVVVVLLFETAKSYILSDNNTITHVLVGIMHLRLEENYSILNE